jgi:hypothetical protein
VVETHQVSSHRTERVEQPTSVRFPESVYSHRVQVSTNVYIKLPEVTEALRWRRRIARSDLQQRRIAFEFCLCAVWNRRVAAEECKGRLPVPRSRQNPLLHVFPWPDQDMLPLDHNLNSKMPSWLIHARVGTIEAFGGFRNESAKRCPGVP